MRISAKKGEEHYRMLPCGCTATQCRVFDYAGQRLDYVLAVDTDKGEIEQIERDPVTNRAKVEPDFMSENKDPTFQPLKIVTNIVKGKFTVMCRVHGKLNS